MRVLDDIRSLFRPPEVRFGATPLKVVGAQSRPLRDAYHAMLRLSWTTTVLLLFSAYVIANALFAVAYMLTGGVANARPGSFADAFFFSVQTLGTIGYGHLEPEALSAHMLVLLESFVSLFMTAVATGIVFARFSQSGSRLQFSETAVIGPMDGVPTLMIRVGNERTSAIVEALVRAVLIRTEKTREGKTFYRIYDLKLVRERSSALMRSWTVMHRIDQDSPLFQASPESVERDEVELVFSVVGTDDVSLQPVHARKSYDGLGLVWGAHHVDIVSQLPDGNYQIDLTKFSATESTEPTDAFPYPRDRVIAGGRATNPCHN